MFIVLSVSIVIHVISGEHRNNFRTDCRFQNMYMLFRACFQVVFRLFSGYFGVCFGLVLGVVFWGGVLPCGRKPEHLEKTHDFRQSVDGLFSHKSTHESVARIEPTTSVMKGACSDNCDTPKPYILSVSVYSYIQGV